MTLVIDTGFVVAALRSSDPHHGACRDLLAGTQERRVLPAPTLPEIGYFLAGTRAWTAVLDDILAGALDVEDLRIEDYQRVRELTDTYADLAVGFVDCAVLAVVERLDEPKLATLDRRHFAVMRPAHRESLALLPAQL